MPEAGRGDADREQVVDVAEGAPRTEKIPAAGFDRVTRAHRREIAQERSCTVSLDERREFADGLLRLAVTAALKQRVLQPGQRVIVAQGRAKVPAPDPCLGGVEGRSIRRSGITPESELKKNMRRHVQRMA